MTAAETLSWMQCRSAVSLATERLNEKSLEPGVICFLISNRKQQTRLDVKKQTSVLKHVGELTGENRITKVFAYYNDAYVSIYDFDKVQKGEH